MSRKPLVSVIVPCYKQAFYLNEALACVQAQTFQDWECIIVNDGSPDNTSDVAHEWENKDSRFCYIEKSNGGISSARNRGVNEAKGDYIQFLDADDLIESKKLEWQVSFLGRYPNVGIVYSDQRYFTTEVPQQRRFTLFDPDEPWVESRWLDSRPFLEKLLECNMMAVNSPLVRRAVLQHVGLFDDRLRTMEDWHYWLRCAAKGNGFYFAPATNTLALVRIHSASASHNHELMKSGAFEMTIKVAGLLASPALRERNFMLGAYRIPNQSRAMTYYQLMRLAWANRCATMPRLLLRSLITRHPSLDRLLGHS